LNVSLPAKPKGLQQSVESRPVILKTTTEHANANSLQRTQDLRKAKAT